MISAAYTLYKNSFLLKGDGPKENWETFGEHLESIPKYLWVASEYSWNKPVILFLFWCP